MKKVTATVIHKGGRIYNLTANNKGSHTTLLQYDMESSVKPYKYEDFDSMYTSVLQILKQNGMYVAKDRMFGADWYDIMWIDLNSPTRTNKYGLIEK